MTVGKVRFRGSTSILRETRGKRRLLVRVPGFLAKSGAAVSRSDVVWSSGLASERVLSTDGFQLTLFGLGRRLA